MLPNTQAPTASTINFLLDNSEQVTVAGGGDLVQNEWAVDGRGNYWSDYTGYDADGDGDRRPALRSKSLFDS